MVIERDLLLFPLPNTVAAGPQFGTAQSVTLTSMKGDVMEVGLGSLVDTHYEELRRAYVVEIRLYHNSNKYVYVCA